MNINHKILTFITAFFLVTLISGCAGHQMRTKSSVVDYLYPKGSETIVKPSIPALNLPLKVGIAFVPEKSSRSRGINFWSGVMGAGALTEVKKSELLEKVASHFRDQKFVSDIEVIPSPYLSASGGFSNLDQIKTIYGVDVIALVSFDQVQFTDEGLLSLTYWTIVGAYIVSGEKNDTNTMLDTAVYDIKSRKMLFRAPGISNVKGTSTPINLSEELRSDSIKGFEEATVSMIKNLDMQLIRFKVKIKDKPDQVKLTYSKGYSGGGAFGFIEILTLFSILFTSIMIKLIWPQPLRLN